MTSLKTAISWTDATWNPTTGCTKASAGCDHCYAEALTNRLWGGGFDTVKLHADRLAQVHGFRPLKQPDGRLLPRAVFVNSMSDLMHRDVPDAFRDRVFDGMEGEPHTIFQVLTKRAMTMRRYVADRFKSRPVPDNIWLGASVEDNRVVGRIDLLRALKESVGAFTAFLSVEPLIGPIDRARFDAMDWILIGGESGPNARPMQVEWARAARDEGRRVGAAIWFKQFGTWPNNPLYAESDAPGHFDRIRQAIARGEQHAAIGPHPKTGRPQLTGEKGGATLDGETLHEHPPAYARVAAALNASLL